MPEIRIEQQEESPATPLADQTKIAVRSLRFSGASAYPDAELIAVAGFAPGEQTLAALRAIAAKITKHYRGNGYFLAQAYLPAQDVKDGTVTIAVIEGQYGKVTVNNPTNLSSTLVNGLLEGLGAGDPITVAPLESRLLQLSELPGVSVKSTLVPGASVGASDLIIDVEPGRRVTGSIDADNAGNRYTGANRVGATVNLNNPTGHGDVATLRALTSASRLNYGRASYQAQFGRAKAGIAYADMRYRLGEEFASLQANGTAQIASVYVSYPLARSRASNVNTLINYDAKTFQDRVDATSTVVDKKAQVWMASLVGDRRDDFAGGGVNSYSLTWTSGEIDIRSPAALATDEATVRTNGRYNKVSLNASRLQSLTRTASLNVAISAQAASKNLDISEKMGLGGASAVRAYPAGEGYGDQGYVLNVEVRQLLPRFSERVPGEMQGVVFVDTGTVTLNKDPWVDAPNRTTLSGAGLGIHWADNNSFAVRAYWAYKLGNAVATSAPDAMSRIWILGVKYF